MSFLSKLYDSMLEVFIVNELHLLSSTCFNAFLLIFSPYFICNERAKERETDKDRYRSFARRLTPRMAVAATSTGPRPVRSQDTDCSPTAFSEQPAPHRDAGVTSSALAKG